MNWKREKAAHLLLVFFLMNADGTRNVNEFTPCIDRLDRENSASRRQ